MVYGPGTPSPPLILLKIAQEDLSLRGNVYQKFEIFAIISYLSPYIPIMLKFHLKLRVHQLHKMSSESLKGAAGIALPSGGDAYWFLVYYIVTLASDLPVRTIRFCFVLFGVTSSLAVIHTIHGRPWLCIARDRAWSSDTSSQQRPGRKCDKLITMQHLPIAKQSPIFVQNRDFSLPHLHSTLPLGRGFPLEHYHDVWYGKTRMMWLLLDGEKFWRYVYSFWQNVRTWQMDSHTDRRTPHDGTGHVCVALRGKNTAQVNY